MTVHNKIFDVADYFLWMGKKEGQEISQLKLQKLCYYAQAWNLALEGAALFEADFEAWIHGPANYDLYKEFKKYGWRPIKAPKNYDEERLSPAERSLLTEVWERYGSFDAKVLENLTHQEDPWIEARGNFSDYENSNEKISKATMETFYRSLVHAAN